MMPCSAGRGNQRRIYNVIHLVQNWRARGVTSWRAPCRDLACGNSGRGARQLRRWLAKSCIDLSKALKVHYIPYFRVRLGAFSCDP